MLASEIQELTELSILSDQVFINLFEIENEVSRLDAEETLLKRAKELNVATAFKRRLQAHKKEFDKFKKENCKSDPLDTSFHLEYTEKGAVRNSIKNYYSILSHDSRFKNKILFNELSGEPEKINEDGSITNWTDTDDSNVRCYIEEKYGIHSEKKTNDALNLVLKEHAYNPVKDLIESFEWDGVSRIKNILSKWLGVEDDAYTREVSRLIFAGGINRLYDPGCKFDDMAVLIGTKQGEGKSTFVRWLALKDDFFREVKDMDGQRGIEILKGAWVCEVGELLALTRTKEVEAAKEYLSRQVDVYRAAYARRITKQKRSCIFIGTTNKKEFLTDKTGNRRFYPVTVNSTGYELHKHKEEIMKDIQQCWAEALTLYKKGELLPYADEELREEFREHQNESVEDDYRVGLIKNYLEGRNEVCILEIWRMALMNEITNPTRKDSCDIGLILTNMPGWRKGKSVKRFIAYGPQKYWERITDDSSEEVLPF